MELEFYDKLTNGGFKVIRNPTQFETSKSLLKRYANIPPTYLLFLNNFESITNPSNTTWFNSNNEFNGETDNEFKWNEFELLSLEWSEDDDNELKKVKDFWKDHIPIVMSVNNGYQFFAICLESEKYGEIVHGQEPVFEDVTKVCNNFKEFIDLLEKRNYKTLSE